MGLHVEVERGTAKPTQRTVSHLVADDENPSRYITSVALDGTRDRIAFRDIVSVRPDFDGLDQVSAIATIARDPALDATTKIERIEAVLTGRTAELQEAPA